MKLKLLYLVYFFSLQAGELQLKTIYAKKPLKLYNNGQHFFVEENNLRCMVKPWLVDAKLRKKSHACLTAMQHHGYINIAKLGNDYKIEFRERGLGGGPLAGWIGYWGTKAICYGTAVAATGTTLVTTGGVAGAAVATLITGATSTASLGTALIGAAIAGGGLATEAAVVTGGAIAAGGSVAAVVAGVETAATSIGAILLACPFLP